ncbi:peptidoglycan-binding protein [Candidatus Kaiserbacteria bacterium]|nr:peptidoglycan-binding protein [Candidatus Kaiserbacteria bacterium]
MYKKAGFVLGVALLASPALAFAQSDSSIQSLIDGLLAQVNALQTQIQQQSGSGTSVSNSGIGSQRIACTQEAKICPDGTAVGRYGPNCSFSPCPTVVPPPDFCTNLTRNLSADDSDASTGGQVTQLQTFLAQDTSIYPEGLVTGYFGPATLRAVQRWQAKNGVVSSGTPDTTGYGFVGTKTRAAIARLCGTPADDGALTASPRQGSAPLTVTFKIYVSSENLSIDFGDGSSQPLNNYMIVDCLPAGDAIPLRCPSQFVTHTYTSNGTYTATLNRTDIAYPTLNSTGCSGDCGTILGFVQKPLSTIVGTARITVGAVSDKPVISAVEGPVTLKPGQSGTWRLKVSSSGTGNVSYSVVWGDEDNSLSASVASPSDVRSSATFTHTYQGAGTYRPKFIVTDTNGSASITAIVSVATDSTRNLLTASPVSGDAPLTVKFSSMVGGGLSLNQVVYKLDFGDGSSTKPEYCFAPADACVTPGVNSHTYSSAGTYTATLTQTLTNVACALGSTGGCGTTVLGTATVKVGGGTTGTPVMSSVSPSSGSVGTRLVIQGKGFTSDNTVHFGSGGKSHVASIEAGTLIYYTIPSSVGPCDVTDSTQLCAQYQQLITPGSYTLYVSNANGSTEKRTITVASPNPVAPLTASPQSGQAPLTVTFKSEAAPGSSLGTSILYGDGTSGTLYPAPTCSTCNLSATGSHTYSTPGTYTALVMSTGPCSAGSSSAVYCERPILGSVQITVTGTVSATKPSITSLSAPTSLKVGQTGTWSVKVLDQGAGNLNYSVVWGDEIYYASPLSMAESSAARVTGTFSHTYQFPGRFTPKFTVSNSNGSVQTSGTVTVSY